MGAMKQDGTPCKRHKWEWIKNVVVMKLRGKYYCTECNHKKLGQPAVDDRRAAK